MVPISFQTKLSNSVLQNALVMSKNDINVLKTLFPALCRPGETWSRPSMKGETEIQPKPESDRASGLDPGLGAGCQSLLSARVGSKFLQVCIEPGIVFSEHLYNFYA